MFRTQRAKVYHTERKCRVLWGYKYEHQTVLTFTSRLVSGTSLVIRRTLQLVAIEVVKQRVSRVNERRRCECPIDKCIARCATLHPASLPGKTDGMPPEIIKRDTFKGVSNHIEQLRSNPPTKKRGTPKNQTSLSAANSTHEETEEDATEADTTKRGGGKGKIPNGCYNPQWDWCNS